MKNAALTALVVSLFATLAHAGDGNGADNARRNRDNAAGYSQAASAEVHGEQSAPYVRQVRERGPH